MTALALYALLAATVYGFLVCMAVCCCTMANGAAWDRRHGFL